MEARPQAGRWRAIDGHGRVLAQRVPLSHGGRADRVEGVFVSDRSRWAIRYGRRERVVDDEVPFRSGGQLQYDLRRSHERVLPGTWVVGVSVRGAGVPLPGASSHGPVF